MINCRVCDSEIFKIFCNLNKTPLANSYRDLNIQIEEEELFNLKVYFCNNCKLVQLPETVFPENIFSDYAYFSSYSKDWLAHSKELCIASLREFQIKHDDLIVEIASNDGYLLKNFKNQNYNNILGIEPATNIAKFANNQNIRTENIFFNAETAKDILKKYKFSKLIFSLNVLAHVPNVKSFVMGIKNILDKDGCWIVEFPHLLNLIKNTQFDTIYHEHFSYFSILTLKFLLKKYDLRIFNIKKIKTHGGSLRVFICHQSSFFKESANVLKIINEEINYGLNDEAIYLNFQQKVNNKKNKIHKYLKNLNDNKICGFGAPAKATTLINYCKIDKYISFIIDNNTNKQNKYLPGTHIPIKDFEYMINTKPKNILVFPWNISDEIIKELNNKGKFDFKIHTLDFN